MGQQAKDEFYNDEVAVAMDYAAAVNEEVKDLFAAGADIVQLDEPYMQARPDKARAFGIAAVNRALEGVTGTTAIHLCFGYAYIVKNKPDEYAFLTELEDSKVDQVSIETAQPKFRRRPSSSASSTCRRWRSRRRRPWPTASSARCRMSMPRASWSPPTAG
jgi:5-methyltetrahydropteroyltriglutamate--homocysteine methyltransferase